MSKILNIVADPVIAVLMILTWWFFFKALFNCFRAAANRKPGVRWGDAFLFHYMIFGRDLYTEEGDKAVARALRGATGFILCVVLGVLIGALTGRLDHH